MTFVDTFCTRSQVNARVLSEPQMTVGFRPMDSYGECGDAMGAWSALEPLKVAYQKGIPVIPEANS